MSNDLVQSVHRAFTILQTVSDHTDGIGVSQIAQQTGLHTSTVSRLITTLESVNALSRLDGGSQVILGEGLIDLVSRAPWTERIIAKTRPVLRELAAETQESVGLTQLEDGLCHVFYQIDSPHHVRIRNWTGYRFPLHVTSSGKLWMANWPEKEVRRYFDKQVEAPASKTVRDYATFSSEFEQIRRDGVAWTMDELEDGLLSIAVAIPQNDPDEIGAIYLSAPIYRFTKKADRDKLAKQVVTAASKIARVAGV